MDGSQIETLILKAAAKAAGAQLKALRLVDFCIAGMKSDRDTQQFLLEVNEARLWCEDAAADLSRISKLYAEAKNR